MFTFPSFEDTVTLQSRKLSEEVTMNGFVSINAKAGLLLPIAALLLQGCLSTLVTKPISESSRDTSGTFDGQWAGTIESTAGQQYGPGNWTFTCDDRSGDRFGPISVKDLSLIHI